VGDGSRIAQPDIAEDLDDDVFDERRLTLGSAQAPNHCAGLTGTCPSRP
jgi:hypothetical protein